MGKKTGREGKRRGGGVSRVTMVLFHVEHGEYVPAEHQRVLVPWGKGSGLRARGAVQILGSIREVKFAGGSGNADGRSSSFGDDGMLAFLATFTDEGSGVFFRPVAHAREGVLLERSV